MRSLALPAISACIVVACDRSPAQTAPGSATLAPASAATDARAISPATAAAPIAQAGVDGRNAAHPRLSFRITRLYQGEAPTDHVPWHGGNGGWVFFDAETSGGGAFTAGIEIKAAKGDNPIRFGKAMIVAPDHDRAERLVGEIAAAYHTSAPRAAAHPRLSSPLQLPIAVLGEHVACQPGGGCGGSGAWTATKWFFAEGEVEVFVNLDLADRQGELDEKDPDYRAGLVAAFASLRDGTAK